MYRRCNAGDTRYTLAALGPRYKFPVWSICPRKAVQIFVLRLTCFNRACVSANRSLWVSHHKNVEIQLTRKKTVICPKRRQTCVFSLKKNTEPLRRRSDAALPLKHARIPVFGHSFQRRGQILQGKLISTTSRSREKWTPSKPPETPRCSEDLVLFWAPSVPRFSRGNPKDRIFPPVKIDKNA